MSEAILEIAGLSVAFGGVRAVDEVTMRVKNDAVQGLIGPNGAGKTTLLNAVTRLVPVASGSIRYLGEDILALPAHALARRGVARTFQNLGLIGELSVLENVAAGLHSRHPGTLLDEIFFIRRRNRFERETLERAWEALRFAGIEGIAAESVTSLPYGTRKAVEFARVMASEPRLMLLDEPTAGLNAMEMGRLTALIQRLRERTKLSILLITHHLEFLSNVADRVTVLDLGRVICSGAPAEVQRDPRVVAAYVGEEA